jgi:FkbM family methyltransferase
MKKTIKYYLRVVGLKGFIYSIIGKIIRKDMLYQVLRPDIKFPIFLRIPSSDVATFDQIFNSKGYDCMTKKSPQIIIDAGANIGLASVFFSNKFPDSKIFAIEPEESNLEVLKRNIAPYKNIISISGALWNENKKISLVDPGVGKWGFTTKEIDNIEKKSEGILQEVQGITLDKIMEDYGIEKIDILKVDIEGSEREVFKNSPSWIQKVDSVIIELHEHNYPGCYSSFYRASNGFENEWKQGENIFISRIGSLLPN